MDSYTLMELTYTEWDQVLINIQITTPTRQDTMASGGRETSGIAIDKSRD